ncbi:unnamed protein product [Sphenostylis stenocarpa]|uniref:Uncharacterized protein n=1 Tax=Sphenostylis stenocarpa TaxID=92480 RepID=A0AA86VXL4_9FABA|nr:unnamed protein product [Sphenostylis stenocarpa]
MEEANVGLRNWIIALSSLPYYMKKRLYKHLHHYAQSLCQSKAWFQEQEKEEEAQMAKGRKFPTTTRSERFLGTTYSSQGSAASVDPSEFREEDVWFTPEDREGDVNASPGEWEPRAWPRRRNSREQQGHRHVGGLSLAFEDPNGSGGGGGGTRIVHHQYRAQHDAVSSSPRGRQHQMATSAPVNVPDWSKILRVDSVESLHDMDDAFDDNDSEMVPPHEYLARSRKMAANSVFEGVGRTLKGRDMRRVRDAVWSQTGFNG